MKNDPEYHRAYYLRNRELLTAKQRERYRTYQREYMRAYRASQSPEQREAELAKRRVTAKATRTARPHLHRKQSIRSWLRRWGTPEDEVVALADELWDRKHGPCDLCGAAPKHRLHDIDHDHATGRVRGVLCSSCNTAIGHFRDDPELIAQALVYLKQPPAAK